MTDTDELERLARAATPGPWKACGTIYEHMNCELRSGAKGEGQAIALFWDGPNAFADGQFAAAANPATILALLSANREMRELLTEAVDVAGLMGVMAQQTDSHWNEDKFEAVNQRLIAVETGARSALTTQRGDVE